MAAAEVLEILIRAKENVSEVVSQVEENLKRLPTAVGQTVSQVNTNLEKMRRYFSALKWAGLAVSGTFVTLVEIGRRYSDALWKQSQQLGVNVEKYSLLASALSDLEVDTQMLPMLIARMTSTLENAAEKADKSKKHISEMELALRSLGISTQAASDPLDMFLKVIERLADIPDTTQRIALAYQIFGRQAVAITPLLQRSREEILQTIEAHRRAGVMISEEVARRLDRFSDAIGTLGNAIKSFFATVASVLLNDLTPAIEKATEWVGKLHEKFKEHPWLARGVTITIGATVGGAWILDWLGKLGFALIGLEKLKEAFSKLGILTIITRIGSALKGLFSIVSSGVGIFGAIALAVGYFIRRLDDATGAVSKFIAKLLNWKATAEDINQTVTDIEYSAEKKRKDIEELEKFYKERPEAARAAREYAEKYYGTYQLAGRSAEEGLRSIAQKASQTLAYYPAFTSEEKRWVEEQIKQLKKYWDTLHQWFNEYRNTVRDYLQKRFEMEKQMRERMVKAYEEALKNYNETLNRIARAHEEYYQRLAEAQEASARLAATLTARAGVFRVKYGPIAGFYIPIAQEIEEAPYRPSPLELAAAYLSQIAFYCYQIWYVVYNIAVLLQQCVNHLAGISLLLTKAVTHQIEINIPFGSDEFRHAVAAAVEDVLASKFAAEILRNA